MYWQKGKKWKKLETLAKNFKINCKKAHDYWRCKNVLMSKRVLMKLNISNAQFKKCILSWTEAENKIILPQNLPNALKKLNALKDCTSLSIGKKMVVANITFDMIVDEYKQNNFEGLLKVLGKDENGIVKVTKDK